MPEKKKELIDSKEVTRLTGLSHGEFPLLQQRGIFPKPRTLAPTGSGWSPRWSLAEVETWIKERKAPTPVSEQRTAEEVCTMCSLTKQELDQKVRAKSFPLPRLQQSGPRWSLGDIHEWILNRQGVA